MIFLFTIPAIAIVVVLLVELTSTYEKGSNL